jgi:hypothetical protein
MSVSKRTIVLTSCSITCRQYDAEREEISSALQDIFRLQASDNSRQFLVLDKIITSCPSSMKHHAIERRREVSATSVYESGGSNENFLSSDIGRASLLGLSLVEEALSLESVAKIKIGLLCVAEKDERLTKFALRWMLHFANSSTSTAGTTRSRSGYDPEVLKDLVRCWWKLLEPSNDIVLTGSLRTHATSHLSSFLTQILKSDDFSAVIVESCIGEYDARRCIHLCVNLANLEQEESNFTGVGNLILLQSLLECYPLRFIPIFLSILDQQGTSLSENWESGLFDECFLVAIRKNGNDLECQQLCTNMMKKILSRTADVFSRDVSGSTRICLHAIYGSPLYNLTSQHHKKETLSTVRSFLEVTEVAMERLPFPGLECDVSKGITRTLEKALKAKHFRSDPSLKVIIGIGMHLIEVNDFKLATRLLVLLFELLPKSYKHQNKDSHCFLQPDTILYWLQSLAKRVKEFDFDFLNTTEKHIVEKLFRSCLKFGVAPSTDSCPAIATQSVRLVRVVLESCFDTTSPFSQLKAHFVIPSPAEVFMMLTSHSKFSMVLADEDNDDRPAEDCSTKTEIFHLMRSCLRLDSSNIFIAESFWQDIYSAFSAGLGESDTAIRLCLQACSTSKAKASWTRCWFQYSASGFLTICIPVSSFL